MIWRSNEVCKQVFNIISDGCFSPTFQGRSKSLTQIDNLVGSSNDMLLIGSHGEDGTTTTGTDKLGIPDETPYRRPPLSTENRVSIK